MALLCKALMAANLAHSSANYRPWLGLACSHSAWGGGGVFSSRVITTCPQHNLGEGGPMGDGGHLRGRGGSGVINGRQEALRMQAATCTAQQVGQAGQSQ